MQAVIRVERFLFETAVWKLVLVIGLLTVFKTGVWYIPNLSASQSIAQDPFRDPFPDPNAHYLFWSWLSPFTAWLIGAEGKWRFFGLHLFFSISFTFLFIRTAFVNFSNDAARSSIVLFSILPVSATAYFWVGSDSLTLLLMVAALAFPSARVLVFFIGVLLGMQHFEQGFFAVAALTFATTISHRQSYTLKYSGTFCALYLLGVVVGKLVLMGIFSYHTIEVNSGRMYWLMAHIDALLSQFFLHFHQIAWSVLGLGWLLALRFADWGARSVPFFLAIAGLLLLLPVVEDQTRVLAIVTFPLVAAYWLVNPDFLGRLTRREVSLLFLAWALMPWGWVWGGEPRWSVFPHNIAYVLHRVFGWFDLPADAALWPF